MEYLEKQLSFLKQAVAEGHEIDDIAPLKVYPQRRFARIVSQLLPQKGTVLEVGCGGSICLHEINRFGFLSTGLDCDPIAQEYFEFLAGHYKSDARFVRGDAFALPFPDTTFDLVYSVGMIEHFNMKEQSQLVNEMWRVTGRHLILAIPNYDGASVFHHLLHHGNEEHHPCDLDALAAELKPAQKTTDGRGVFADAKLAAQNSEYFQFLCTHFPLLVRDRFYARDIELLIASENSLSAKQRAKYGFVKYLHLVKDARL